MKNIPNTDTDIVCRSFYHIFILLITYILPMMISHKQPSYVFLFLCNGVIFNVPHYDEISVHFEWCQYLMLLSGAINVYFNLVSRAIIPRHVSCCIQLCSRHIYVSIMRHNWCTRNVVEGQTLHCFRLYL